MPKKGVDMVSPFLLDEHLNGMSDEFLDNVIKHIDFPLEDLEGNAHTEDWDASFQLLELPSPDDLTGISANFKLCDDNSGSLRRSSKKEVKPKLKDSPLGNSETNVDRNVFHHRTFEGKDSSMFPSSSSVSVLESGSSWSADNSLHFGYRFFIPVKRARSKRLRPLTLNPRLPIPFVSCSDKRKGKKKNMSVLSVSGSSTGETDHPHLQLSGSGSGGSRKCTHCEVTKTPQWREGPMGPKTLCNACGVRYRSGRLFPEYRPAASPTFVASMHSNSHKKVVEMRKKSTREAPMAAIDSLRAPQFGNSNGCLSV